MARTFLTLALLLTACQDGDDGGGDTDVDTDTGPVTGTVSVAVESSPGVPSAGLTVVFHAADGTVLSSAVTDVSGLASAEVTGEAAITVVRGDGLFTVAGVVPGDDVRLDAWVEPDATAGPTVHVEVGAYAAADGYRVSAGCVPRSDADVAGGFDVVAGEVCRTEGGGVDLLAVAYEGITPLAYTSLLDVPTTGVVTLPTPWRTDWSTRTVAVEGATPGTGEVFAGVAFWRRGRSFFASGAAGAVDIWGGVAVPIRAPGSFAERTETTLDVVYARDDREPAYGRIRVVEPGPVPPSRVFDGAGIPRPPDVVTIDATDVARPSFAWSGGSAEDVVVFAFGAEGTGGGFTWTLLTPGDAGGVTVPALPDDLAAYRPVVAPVAYGVTTMSVTGVPAHELLVGWNVVARAVTGAPLGDAYQGLRVGQLLVAP